MGKVVWIDGDEIAFKLATKAEHKFVTYDGRMFKTVTAAKVVVDDFDPSLLQYHVEGIVDWRDKIADSLQWYMNGLKYWCGDKHVMVFGENSFRKEIAKMQLYKNSRNNTERPQVLSDVRDMLRGEFESVDALFAYEGDDALVINCLEYGGVIASSDKDLFTVPCRVTTLQNPSKPIDCNVFGGLRLNASGSVKGIGRKFAYFQVLFGDVSDCYRPFIHSKSVKRYGEKGIKADLDKLTTDKQCVDFIVQKYQQAYPEPFTFTDHDGVLQTFTWQTALQEILHCCYMRRFYGDEMGLDRFMEKGFV